MSRIVCITADRCPEGCGFRITRNSDMPRCLGSIEKARRSILEQVHEAFDDFYDAAMGWKGRPRSFVTTIA